MRRPALLLAALAALAAPAPAAAQLSIMPKITTGLGVGADLALGLGDWVVVRAGGAFLPWEPVFTVEDIDWSVATPISGVGALDLHLGGTGFRVSGGVFYLAEEIEVTAELRQDVEVGDQTWSREEVGTLTGRFGIGDVLPFLSAGYGHASAPGVGLFLEAGAAFFSESSVELESEGGTRSDDEDFQAALRSQESVTERELDDIGLWPILTVGIRIGAGF